MGKEVEVQSRGEMDIVRNRQVRNEIQDKQVELEEELAKLKKEHSALKGTVTKLSKKVKGAK